MSSFWSNKWSNIQPFFSSVKTKWSGFLKICSKSEIVFSQADFTWGEYALAIELQKFVGAGVHFDEYYNKARQKEFDTWQKDENNKKRFIKVLCKIQGKVYKEQKDYKNVKLKIKDAELIVEKVLNRKISVLVENVNFNGEQECHTNSIQIKVNNLNVQ